ncbi:spermidine/putrescine transport system ATP-binding protein [Roseovarius litoreus]|uniref:Spermidine/putrescine transport system ATP-binding protein n=2 Tax=Roseovarius litoreus TaxID=1155722 RepID=A0A1M7DR33_9RHOB|nr:spermidine/putrescine transport system ATP-binding protein [Roseovarius litoreus]
MGAVRNLSGQKIVMHGKDVCLQGVSITYPNGFTAVKPTDLTIGAGEFFSILGPSGCGKTTILRAVSGFVEPSAGRVLIGGEDQRGIGPNGRPTALIFQNLALFPLMPVWENVAFALEARGIPRKERRARAHDLLELVALPDQADKMPGELSGGQRQRVAIARALAVEPAVLLLDEPLSALDLKLRQHMRAELRAIQQKTGVTFIYITHDQGEALTMSDRVAVMNDGVVEQVGTADEIYSDPRSAFVASFVGEVNAFYGRVVALDDRMASIDTPHGLLRGRHTGALTQGDQAILFVRPQQVEFGEDSGANRFSVMLERRSLEGAFLTFETRTDNGARIIIHQTNSGPSPVTTDSSLQVSFAPDAAVVLPDGPVANTGIETAAQ